MAPRPIAADCVAESLLVPGALVAFAGWGAVDEWGEQYTEQLHEGRSQLSDPYCEDLDIGCNPDVSPGGELAARSEDGADTCNGDSGGPLYVIPNQGPALLAGVTSRAAWSLDEDGPACAGQGLYVRADAVMPWIEAVTGRALPRPVCDDGWQPQITPPPVGDEVRGGCDSTGGGGLGWGVLGLLALRRRSTRPPRI